MGSFWKVMVALMLTVPMAAYIMGTLMASQAEMPSRRTPIVITESQSGSTSASSSPRPSNGPAQTSRPSKHPTAQSTDLRRGSGGSGGDDGPEIVRPTPNDIDADDSGGRIGGDDVAERDDDGADTDDGDDDD
jgi:hypothetical protein